MGALDLEIICLPHSDVLVLQKKSKGCAMEQSTEIITV